MELKMEMMEQAAGGTVAELEELLQSLSNTNMVKTLGSIGSHLPGTNQKIGTMLKSLLKGMNINADLNLGLFGTGLLAGPNTYTSAQDGRSMSHEEVLKRIAKLGR